MPFRAHPKDAATILYKGWRMQNMYPIRKPDRTLSPIKFGDRPIQQALFDYAESQNFRGIRLVNAKSRKQGVTSFWSAYYLDETLWVPNTTTCIVAHKVTDVRKIFRIVKTMYRYCPKEIQMANGKVWEKPIAKYDNVNELYFPSINSGIYVAIESRGETNNNLHISEAHFIPKAEERMAGTIESVPNRERGSNITIESTSNGVGGWFYDTWYDAIKGVNGYGTLFFPWFKNPENKLRPPADFFPTVGEQEMIVRVEEEYGVLLDISQVFWWRMTKAQQKRLMDQEHPTFVDDSFLSSQAMVFNSDRVRHIKTRDPIRVTQSGIKIFKEPIPGRRYVVFGDPAEGGGGDNSAAEVVDCVTLEQVAEFVSNTIKPTDFGSKLLPELARMYNKALLAIERNNHGHTVIDNAKRVYSNLYMEKRFDEKTNKTTNKIGWLTTGRTKDLMLNKMDSLVDDDDVTINSVILKSEMLTFVTDEDGKRQAKSGCRDDCVMAMAGALTIASMPKASYGVYDLS